MFEDKTLKIVVPRINKQLLIRNKIYFDNVITHTAMYASASGLDAEVPSDW
jgi:K+-transporting ATPase c subunit